MRNTNLLPRFLALFLALSLALPGPTLALRIANPVETGIEENIAKSLGHPRSAAPAAGLEEWAIEEPLRRFTGHTGSIWALAFSLAGQTMAFGGPDRTVRLWDVATGSSKEILNGHTGSIRALAFSPDGQTMASAGDDGTVRLWDVATGSPKATFPGHLRLIQALAFSPDGQTMASAGPDRTIRLWDVATGSSKEILIGHTSSIRALAFSPDGQTVASTGGDGTVRLSDVATGSSKEILTGHTGSIRALAFYPDGKTVASAGGDGTVRLWDVATGSPKATFPGHTDSIFPALAFSPDGQTMASAGTDGTVVLSGPSFATLERRLEAADATAAEKISAIRILGLRGGKEAFSKLFDLLEGADSELLPALRSAVSTVLIYPERAVVLETRQWAVLLERLAFALRQELVPEQQERILQGFAAAVRLKGPPLEKEVIRQAAGGVLASLGLSFSRAEEKAFVKLAPKNQIAQALWAVALRSRLKADAALFLTHASVRNRLDMARLLVLIDLLRLEPALAGFLDQAAAIAAKLPETPQNQYLAALLKEWLPTMVSTRPALYALGLDRLFAGQLQASFESAQTLAAASQELNRVISAEAGRVLKVAFDPDRPSPLTDPRIPELRRRMFLQAVLYQAEHQGPALSRALGTYLVSLQKGVEESQALAEVHEALAEEASSLPAPLPEPPAPIERRVQPLSSVQAQAENQTRTLWQEIRTHLQDLASRMPTGEFREGLNGFVAHAPDATLGPDQTRGLQSGFQALSQRILEDPQAGQVQEIRTLVKTIRTHLNDLLSQRVAQEKEIQPVDVRITFVRDPVSKLHVGWPDLQHSCLNCVDGTYRAHAQEYATHPGVMVLFAFDAEAARQTSPPFARLAALRTQEGSLLVTSRLRSDRALDLMPVFAEALQLYAQESGQPVLLPADFFNDSPGLGWKSVTVTEVTLPEGAEAGFYSDLTGDIKLPHALADLAVWQYTPPALLAPAAGVEEVSEEFRAAVGKLLHPSGIDERRAAFRELNTQISAVQPNGREAKLQTLIPVLVKILDIQQDPSPIFSSDSLREEAAELLKTIGVAVPEVVAAFEVAILGTGPNREGRVADAESRGLILMNLNPAAITFPSRETLRMGIQLFDEANEAETDDLNKETAEQQWALGTILANLLEATSYETRHQTLQRLYEEWESLEDSDSPITGAALQLWARYEWLLLAALRRETNLVQAVWIATALSNYFRWHPAEQQEAVARRLLPAMREVQERFPFPKPGTQPRVRALTERLDGFVTGIQAAVPPPVSLSVWDFLNAGVMEREGRPPGIPDRGMEISQWASDFLRKEVSELSFAIGKTGTVGLQWTGDGEVFLTIRKPGTALQSVGPFVFPEPAADGRRRTEIRVRLGRAPVRSPAESEAGVILLPIFSGDDSVSRNHVDVVLGSDGSVTVVKATPQSNPTGFLSALQNTDLIQGLQDAFSGLIEDNNRGLEENAETGSIGLDGETWELWVGLDREGRLTDVGNPNSGSFYVLQVGSNNRRGYHIRQVLRGTSAPEPFLAIVAEANQGNAGLEEDSLKEWFGISNKIYKVWLGRTAHRLLPIPADWVGLPETGEWWKQVATASGWDGLRLLLGLGDAPNQSGSRDSGVFITLVKRGQKLFVYQDSSLIGTITPGEILTVGRSSPEMKGRITEQALPDGKYLSAKRHLAIRWEEGKGIFLVDLSSDKGSGKGTWMDASLARQLFPDIPFLEEEADTDPSPNDLVDLELWSRSPSVPVLERGVFGKPPVPMLEVSGGWNGRRLGIPVQVHFPADKEWWNAAREKGLHVVAGIARDNPNDVSQKIGPVLFLEMEGGRIWIDQVVETEKRYGIGEQPTSVRKLVGSVGPGEEIVIGRNSLPGFGKIEESEEPEEPNETRISSRQHFSVRWETREQDRIVIEDQGSRRGTYLFQDEVAEILEAVERQEFRSPPGVGLVLRGGWVVAAEGMPRELVDWVTSLIAVTLQQVRQLYEGGTVVTREGKRYSLAFLPGDPASLEELSGRKLFVQQGMFSPEVLKILGRRNEVFELEPSWAELMVGAAEELASAGELKPILIITSGSALDQAIVSAFSRYAEGKLQEGQEGAEGAEGAEWKVPIATVFVPSEVAIGEWPVENIVEYLLDLIRRVDDLPGRTDETLRAFEQHSEAIRVLIELA